MNPLLEELSWRGLLHTQMPGIDELLTKESVTGYIGFDPTADSLHIGSLVPIILLVHLQNFGHRPIALIGGATGMIGDPSGKSEERNLLNDEILHHNIEGIKSQLSRFLDFDSSKENTALLVNNADWMKEFSFIEFARDIGKHITVNYMMAKESVKKRISSESSVGMSFTEFTYQLIQGYDFLHLYKELNCKLQMGGSDQWGNMTTGTELVRRKAQGEAFAITCPLTTKSDGSKFGKSEGGKNIWLDINKTSSYTFYQFWLNQTDVDTEKYIRIYTFLDKETCENLIEQHKEAPHQRLLQKRLAEEITVWVHGKQEYENALNASNILFGKSTSEDLKQLDEATFLAVFDGVPQGEISLEKIKAGVLAEDILTESGFLSSKSEAKRALKENSVSVNKEKITADFTCSTENLINEKFILLQRGKKKYFVLKVSS